MERSPLLSLDSVSAIRSEVEQRYQAALTATRAADIVNSNDTRFTWASEAKVACGIAIGYLKTRAIDEDSINKCDDYSRRMTAMPTPPPPEAPRPPPPVAAACSVQLPIKFYFNWDRSDPPAEAGAVIAATVDGLRNCGWTKLQVAGHADSSGATPYNQNLSEQRARHIADMLAAAGVPANMILLAAFGETQLAVPTPDGVREPLNRRVEVNAQ